MISTYAERRKDAFIRLGVKPQDVYSMVQITPQLGQIAKQLQHITREQNGAAPSPMSDLPTNPYYYLHASDHPDARKVLDQYYSIGKSLRTLLPLEAYCLAAGISPLNILEIIVAACVRMGAVSSSIIAAVASPRVVEKTVSMALTDAGEKDREILHKHTGFLPMPKGGPNVRVNVNNSSNAQASSELKNATIVPVPAPEQTIRRLEDRFNDRSQLAAPQTLQLPAPQPTQSIPKFVREAIPVGARVDPVEEEEDDHEDS